MATEKKVWGSSIEIHNNKISRTTVLRIKKGGTCSLHFHQHRYNAFYVVSGEVVIRWSPSSNSKNRFELYLRPGNDPTFLAPGEIHEFAAIEDSVVVEVDYADATDGDIVRIRPGFIDKKIKDKRFTTMKLKW